MRIALLFLAYVIGAHSLAPIISSQDVVKDSYVVVLKTSVSKEELVSHMQRAKLVLGAKAAGSLKAFDIAGLQGYTVVATVETINTWAESDEVKKGCPISSVPTIWDHIGPLLGQELTRA